MPFESETVTLKDIIKLFVSSLGFITYMGLGMTLCL